MQLFPLRHRLRGTLRLLLYRGAAHREALRRERSGGRGRTCTCEGETPLDLQSSAFAAQPHAQ